MDDALSDLERVDEALTPYVAWTALFRLREKDAKRWALAAYLVGLAAAVALVAAIILAVFGQGGGAVASAVGTVVTGAATGWLWIRRTEVQDEAVEFLEKVQQYCPSDVADALAQ